MPTIYRLNKQEVKKIFLLKRNFFSLQTLSVKYNLTSEPFVKYAVAVSKKAYKAVERNRVKRILRHEIINSAKKYNLNHCNFIIIANNLFLNFPRQVYLKDIDAAFKKLAKFTK